MINRIMPVVQNVLDFARPLDLRLILGRDQNYLIQFFIGITEAAYLSKISQNEDYSPLQDSAFRRVKLVKDGKDHPIELPSPAGSMILGLPDQ